MNAVREYLVIYGPACSGKTLNAQAIKEELGYDHVFDANFDRAAILQAKGRIILLSQAECVRDPDHAGRPYQYIMKVMSVAAVRDLLGPKWIKPNPNYKPETFPPFGGKAPAEQAWGVENTHALRIGKRWFFRMGKRGRILTAWSLAGAKHFAQLKDASDMFQKLCVKRSDVVLVHIQAQPAFVVRAVRTFYTP